MAESPSQLPHDQRDSEVRDAIEGFKDFWARWGNAILLTITAILVVWAAYRFWSTRQEQAYEEAWTDLTVATSPADFNDAATKHSDPAVSALARLYAADLLLHEAVQPDAAAGDADDGADTPEGKLKWAGDLYQEVAGDPPHEVFRLRALMGIAQVAESRGAWDAAAKAYDEVIDHADRRYEYYASAARQRLALLDELQEPVVFTPEPTSPVSPSTAPAIEPLPDPGMSTGNGDEMIPPADITPSPAE